MAVTDNFTDTNGTALTSHVMDTGGLAWSNPGGTGQIQSNHAIFTGAESDSATVDTGVSDGLMTVSFKPGTHTFYHTTSLSFRGGVGGSNTVILNSSAAYDELVIQSTQSGVIHAQEIHLTDGVEYTVEIDMSGSSVVVSFVDDSGPVSVPLTITDNQTKTIFGFGSLGSGPLTPTRFNSFSMDGSGGGGGGGGSAGCYLTDTFPGTNGDAIEDHDPDGGNPWFQGQIASGVYTTTTGTYTIQSNKLSIGFPGSADEVVAISNIDAANNYSFAFTAVLGDTTGGGTVQQDFGVVFCYTDGANYYKILFSRTGAGVGVVTGISYRTATGAIAMSGSVVLTNWVIGNAYDINLSISGGVITVSVLRVSTGVTYSGSLTVPAPDSINTGSYVGFTVPYQANSGTPVNTTADSLVVCPVPNPVYYGASRRTPRRLQLDLLSPELLDASPTIRHRGSMRDVPSTDISQLHLLYLRFTLAVSVPDEPPTADPDQPVLPVWELAYVPRR